MPLRSEAQRRFLFANNPKLAKKFAEETPKNAKIPEKVKARQKALRKRAGSR
jgi:hypothetical protein